MLTTTSYMVFERLCIPILISAHLNAVDLPYFGRQTFLLLQNCYEAGVSLCRRAVCHAAVACCAVSVSGGETAAVLNGVLVTVCLWQQHLALFREWLGESQAAPHTVYTRSLELKVTHFAFPYQQPPLIALNSTDCRGLCMGLHSAILERIGCVWLGEACVWLSLQQCPEVIWKCPCTRTLCVHTGLLCGLPVCWKIYGVVKNLGFSSSLAHLSPLSGIWIFWALSIWLPFSAGRQGLKVSDCLRLSSRVLRVMSSKDSWTNRS